MKLISIVIPCYNSEATIRKVVEMVMEEFKKMDGYDCEFVLVNPERQYVWGDQEAR